MLSPQLLSLWLAAYSTYEKVEEGSINVEARYTLMSLS